MSVSLWQRGGDEELVRAGVVVVGGGIAGVSAALAFEEAGVDALVVERGSIGCGASSRNAGYLMRGAADNYAAAVRDFGREEARALWVLSEENLRLLEEAGASSLRSFERRPSCLLAIEEREAEELEASARLMEEDGFACELVRSGEDAAWSGLRPRAGLVNAGDAVVDPAELVGWLASRLRRSPAVGREVFAVEESGGGVVVRAGGLRVEAERCLVCLNAFTPPLIPGARDWIEPNRGQMLALRAPGARLDHAYYANHGSEYFRRVDEQTVIVGGWRKHFEEQERTASDQPTPEVQAGLEGFAERALGGRHEVTARWAGTMGFSVTGRPIVAPVGGSDGAPAGGRVWVCGGFTGHGMSLAHATARSAAGCVMGRAEPPFPAPAAGSASG